MLIMLVHAAISPAAGQGRQALPPDIAGLLTNAAQLSDSQYMRTAVIQAISQRPDLVEPIISTATQLAPAHADAVKSSAAAAFPGFAAQIGAPGPARPGGRARPSPVLADATGSQQRSGQVVAASPSSPSSLAPPAAGEIELTGFYVGGAGGANFHDDADLSSGIPALNTSADFDIGPAVAGSLGYRFGNGFRGEFEIGYRTNDIDSVTGLAGVGGDLDNLGFMWNLLYDFEVTPQFTPYLGLGMGVARGEIDTDAVLGFSVDDRDAAFAYQAIAGFGYMVTEQLQLFTDYRYFRSADYHFDTPTGVGFSVENENHTLFAGVRFYFGERKPAPVRPTIAPSPPPPPPPPPPVTRPAPPPPPEVARFYLVFFDWDRADLTAEAHAIIRTAADNARAGRITRLDLVGHADRSGPDAYNVRLSQRRAEAVRAELVRLGVPVQEIGLDWRGEREPLVPTRDGAREPQNRRVSITFP